MFAFVSGHLVEREKGARRGEEAEGEGGGLLADDYLFEYQRLFACFVKTYKLFTRSNVKIYRFRACFVRYVAEAGYKSFPKPAFLKYASVANNGIFSIHSWSTYDFIEVRNPLSLKSGNSSVTLICILVQS